MFKNEIEWTTGAETTLWSVSLTEGGREDVPVAMTRRTVAARRRKDPQ